MNTSSHRMTYVSPQSEVIVFQAESSFMGASTTGATGSASFSASFGFGEGLDENGGSI